MNYSTSEVCDITGVTLRQVLYWNQQRVVGPPPAGPGNPLRWTHQDLLTVMIIRDLRALGVPLDRIDLAIKVVPNVLPSLLVIEATRCEWVSEIPTDLSSYVVVRMDLLIDELNEKISNYPSIS